MTPDNEDKQSMENKAKLEYFQKLQLMVLPCQWPALQLEMEKKSNTNQGITQLK